MLQSDFDLMGALGLAVVVLTALDGRAASITMAGS